MSKKETIGVIGGGNMGSAIIRGIVEHHTVLVYEKETRRATQLRRQFGLQTCGLEHLMAKAKIIILAVKPQDFAPLLKAMEPLIQEKQMVVSIAAGITCGYVEKILGKTTRVVRCMPNLPAQIGQGITALCKGKSSTMTDIKRVSAIFDTIGKTVVVEEGMMDAVTAISGSGPAYVYYFIENFVNAAKALGLKEKLSKTLVIQTLEGSLTLLKNRREDVEGLRAQVTSKGGTTAAALSVMTKQKFAKIMMEATKAAKRRAKELAL